MFSVLLVLLAFQSSQDTYTLWLTNHKRMEIKQAPSCQGSLCKLTLLNGDVASMPAKLINLEKSSAFNAERAQRREAARAAASEAARAASEAEAQMREKNKARVLRLSADDELPKYDRSLAGTQGTLSVEPSSIRVGDPIVRDFDENLPVYVGREVITRFTDHYTVDCTVKVNHPAGVNQVEVKMRVNYDQSPPEVLTQMLSHRIEYGATGLLTFNLPHGDDLLGISYEVVGSATAPSVPQSNQVMNEEQE